MSSWRESLPRQPWGFALRAVFAVLALCGLLVFAASWWLPGLIHHVDALFRQRHVEPTQFLLEASQRRLESDRSGALRAVAQHLENDLADVRPGDRLEMSRRATSAWLLARYLEDDKSAAAIELLDDMIEFDPRDIRKRVQQIDLLMADPAQADRGAARLRRLFAELPSVPKISQRMLNLALADGDAVEAVEAAYYLSQGVRETWLGDDSRWRCYWTVEEGRFDRQRLVVAPARLASGSEVRVVGKITAEDGDLHAFRVNMPPYLAAQLSNLTFAFRTPTAELRFAAEELPLRSRGIDTLSAGRFASRGETQQLIFFTLPASLSAAARKLNLSQGGEFEIRAQVKERMPQAVADLLESPDVLQQVLERVSRPVGDFVLRSASPQQENLQGERP